MSPRERDRSVVPMPPDEGEMRTIDAAREALVPTEDQREGLRRRLDGVFPAVEALRVRRGRLRLVLAGALVAALLAIGWLTVPLLWQEPAPAAGRPPIDTVATSVAEVRTLQPERWVDVELRELTTVDVARTTGGAVALLLREGEIDVEVDPGRGDREVRVVAGKIMVQVSGTLFTVSRQDQRVGVSVHRGSVVVRWPSGETVLAEGGRWQSWADSGSSMAAASGPSLFDTNVSEISSTSSGGGTSVAPSIRAPHTAPPAPAEPGGEAGEALALAPVPAAPSADAEALLLSRIAIQRGANVPAVDRLEDIARFLAEHPDSASTEEVMALQVEALADAGEDREALAAAERFLDRYPAGERRSEILWIEATVARDRIRDCERALPAYRELARTITPRRAEALFYRGICADDLGLDEEARDTLSQALDLGLPADQVEAATSILSKQ